MKSRIIITAMLSVVLLGSFSAAYQPASAVTTIIFDHLDVGTGSLNLNSPGSFSLSSDSDVNPNLPFVLDRFIGIDYSTGSADIQIELNNISAPGSLLLQTFTGTATYDMFIDYSSISGLDLSTTESFDFFFTGNTDPTLEVEIEADDDIGDTLTCAPKSVPTTASPTVSFNLATDCSGPVFNPDQVTNLTFVIFNTASSGSFNLDAIQATLSATVPDAPINLIATTGPASGEVTLSWTAPLDDGGSSITDYSVNFVLTGGTIFSEFTHTPSTATSIVVTVLSPGTVYDFHVHAINIVGESLSSNTATVTAGAPAGGGTAIGGTLISIDTTALLLAGVQSISMWMIPVVVAGIGIAIFVITRRK